MILFNGLYNIDLKKFKMKKKIFGAVLGTTVLIVGAISLSINTASASVEAPGYKNARNAYGDANYEIQCCKNENFRNCKLLIKC
jgi:hypothetical protein